MKHLITVALMLVVLWAAACGLCAALGAAMSGHGPTGFLAALYVVCTAPFAVLWAADVAAPVKRHG